MISNFHTASSAPGPAYYTLAGFSDGGKNQKKTHRRGSRENLSKNARSRLNSGDASQSETSSNGASLAYSAGSSQSAGESTDSSVFSDILKLLDGEEKNDMSKLERKLQMEAAKRGAAKGGSITSHSNHSATSSLNYSDTDGEQSLTPSYPKSLDRNKLIRGYSSNSNYSTDYSTDQESQLEGSKLIQTLMDDAKQKKPSSNIRLLGDDDEDDEKEEEFPFDIPTVPATSPPRKKTNTNPSPVKATLASSSPSRTLQTNAPQSATTTSTRGDASVSSRRSNTTSGSKGRQTKKQTASKKVPVDDSADVPTWNCGAEFEKAFPESMRGNVRQFTNIVRPFLCGVI